MQDANFQQWLDARGYDSQRWAPELLSMLKRRFRSEQAIRPDHRLIVDQRGCAWPQRVHRVGEVTSC